MITTYDMTLESLVSHGNTSLTITVRCLVSEGFLTKEQGQEILSNYAIVIVKRGLWGKIWDKIFGIDNNEGGLRYQMVKACRIAQFDIPMKEEEDEPENDLDEMVEELKKDL